MDDNTGFSVGKVEIYSTEKLISHLNAYVDRANALSQMGIEYNDKVRNILNDSSLSQGDRLSQAQTWSGVRDTANNMSEEALKKAWACRVEIDLREKNLQ